MSHNEITGDRLISKPSSSYADNWDKILRSELVALLDSLLYAY